MRLGDEAYGLSVHHEIATRTKRATTFASVYATLARLEEKGLVASWMSEPTAERGGKSRRCVRVEPRGLQQLRESREAVDRMWRGLDPRLQGAR